jgi:hypothetical protein
MLTRLAAAIVLALAAAPSAAQPRSPEYLAIDFALARGRLLYAIDRAASVATDDLQRRMRNWRSAGIGGYVVDRDGSALQVLFYGGPADAPVAYYRARVVDGRVASRQLFDAQARPALTPPQRRLVAAREAALRATRRQPCGRAPFNTAVIPPETEGGPIDVYLMTPQERSGAFPFGGHYRVTVAADGSLSGERAFSNGCLLMDRRQSGSRGRAVAMVVTHLLDPVPTEIHVFNALSARLPVVVGMPSSGRVYQVSGEEIRLLAELSPTGAK